MPKGKGYAKPKVTVNKATTLNRPIRSSIVPAGQKASVRGGGKTKYFGTPAKDMQ